MEKQSAHKGRTPQQWISYLKSKDAPQNLIDMVKDIEESGKKYNRSEEYILRTIIDKIPEKYLKEPTSKHGPEKSGPKAEPQKKSSIKDIKNIDELLKIAVEDDFFNETSKPKERRFRGVIYVDIFVPETDDIEIDKSQADQILSNYANEIPNAYVGGMVAYGDHKLGKIAVHHKYEIYYKKNVPVGMNGRGIQYIVNTETNEKMNPDEGLQTIDEDLTESIPDYTAYEISLYVGNATFFTYDLMIDYSPDKVSDDVIDKINNWLDINTVFKEIEG